MQHFYLITIVIHGLAGARGTTNWVVSNNTKYISASVFDATTYLLQIVLDVLLVVHLIQQFGFVQVL